LGESEASESGALLEPGEPALLLLLASEGENRIHHQRALHGAEAAQAAVTAFQFLHQQSILDVAHFGAAVAFEVGAEEAQLRHLRDQVPREGGLAVMFLYDRNHTVFDKAARGLPDHQLLLAEQGIDLQVVDASKGEHSSHCSLIDDLLIS